MGKKIQDLVESVALLADDDVLIKSGTQDYKITSENFRKTLGMEGEDVSLTGTTALPAVTDVQLLADAVGEHEDEINALDPNAEENQFAFSTIEVAGQSDISAGNKTDTVSVVEGAGITLTTSGSDLTIINSSPNVDQTITAGDGLVGGGSGSNVTLDVGAGDGITVASDTVSVDTTVLRQNTAIQIRQLNYQTHVDSSIAGGVFSLTSGYGFYRVASEGGSGADDLDTISGGVTSQELILMAPTSLTSNPTVKHATGNIYLAGGVDFTFSSDKDVLKLFKLSSGSWVEMSRSNNS